jgi:hypothetical protein
VSGDQPRALHVNDCANYTVRLLREAQRRGLPWSYLPVAAKGRTWSGVRAHAQRAALGAAWLARLATEARRADVVHVHSGAVVRHSRLAVRRFVLNLHGTDIRTLQYDPHWERVIRWGVRRAEAVFYSTPDLAEHVLPHRADAIYLPVPIDLEHLPPWQPESERPSVFFASRWDASKGVEAQLRIADGLVRALAGTAEVVGLDWGPDAPRAAALGVRLVPPRDHAGFLQLMAGAHVVVGQSAGILATSELEALGIGVPLAMTAHPWLYGDSPLPVLGALDAPAPAPLSDAAVADVVESVREALRDPRAAAERLAGREWVRRHHDAGAAVDLVTRTYADVLRRR